MLLVECLTQQKPYSHLYLTPVQVAIQVRRAGVGGGGQGPARPSSLQQPSPALPPCRSPPGSPAIPTALALQVADGSLHPQIPDCHPALAELLAAIFSFDPLERPPFGLVVARLEAVLHEVRLQAAAAQAEGLLGRWFKGASHAALAAAGSSGSIKG